MNNDQDWFQHFKEMVPKLCAKAPKDNIDYW